MNKIIISFLLGLIYFPLSSVAANYSFNYFKKEDLSFSVMSGFRKDAFNLELLNSESNDQLLSELDASDINMKEIQSNFSYDNSSGNLHIDGELNYAKAYSGTFRDLDWDEYGYESSRTYHSLKGSDVYGSKLAIGWNFYNKVDSMLKITPLFGYSIQNQYLLISGNEYFLKDSSYESMWYGPFLGAQLDSKINNKNSIIIRAEYHYNKYKGKGNWINREEFLQDKGYNFKDRGVGKGLDLVVAYAHKINENIKFNLNVNYKNFNLHNGNTTTYLADGDILSYNGIKKITWKSKSVMVGISYNF